MRTIVLSLALLAAGPCLAQGLQPKSPPTDLSFAGLFDADPSYPFFAHAEQVPFQPEAAGYNQANAWWLAEMSMLAYGDIGAGGFVESTLARAGFSMRPIGGSDSGGTQGFIAWNDDCVIVCFRGTEVQEKADVITDIRFCLTGEGEGEGGVHEGFRDALDQVWRDVDRNLRGLAGGRKVIFTGHSLGAALATLGAGRWSEAGEVQAVYTFGSPRVGDEGFQKRYPVRNHHRLEHNNDIVTMVPLDRSLLDRALFARELPFLDRIAPLSYRHVGNNLLIDHDGKVIPGADFGRRVQSRLDGMRAAFRAAISDDVLDLRSVDHLQDHSPRYYVLATWNDYVAGLEPEQPEPEPEEPPARTYAQRIGDYFRSLYDRFRAHRGLLDRVPFGR